MYYSGQHPTSLLSQSGFAINMRSRRHQRCGSVYINTGCVVLDVDASDDPCHGQQEFEFFNRYYDSHRYLPFLLHVTDKGDGHPPPQRTFTSENGRMPGRPKNACAR